MASSAYDFSSAPQSVPIKRNSGQGKYRQEPPPNDENLLSSNNIMFDTRVIRGNTYAAQVITQDQQRTQNTSSRNESARQQAKLNKSRGDSRSGNGRGTPPPVGGRAHVDVQTDTYMEELTDRPVEVTSSTQTSALLDRPSSPLFTRTKIGVDCDTQVEEGELFDFETEVMDVLDVLVGKTLEVSMIELLQEEELKSIRLNQNKFELIRNAELSELQRLEYETKRKFNEKQRRKKQEKEYMQAQETLRLKIASQSFAREYLKDLNASVMDDLLADGYFADPVRTEVSDVFLPWLFDSVSVRLDSVVEGYKVLDTVIRTALDKAVVIREEAVKVEEERLRVIEVARVAEEERVKEVERIKEEERLKKEEEEKKEGEGEGEEGEGEEE